MSEPHELLGVAADANVETIDRAWKRKLMECHPDRHPTATPSERAALQDRTSEINQAHDVLLRQVAFRSIPPTPLHSPLPRQPAARPASRAPVPPPPTGYGPDRCDECGASPAAEFTFRSTRWFRFSITSGRLCRDCALRIGRTVQTTAAVRLLATPFRQTRDLFGNFAELRRAKRLGTASGRRRTVPSPPALRYRAAMTLAVVRPLLIVAVLVVIATSSSGTTTPPGATHAELTAAAQVLPAVSPNTRIAATFDHVFAIGECLDATRGVATLVDCTDHSFVVLHLVDNPADCAGQGALLIYNQPHPACARER